MSSWLATVHHKKLHVNRYIAQCVRRIIARGVLLLLLFLQRSSRRELGESEKVFPFHAQSRVGKFSFFEKFLSRKILIIAVH